MSGLPAWLLLADCVNRPDLDWFSDSPAGIAAAKAVCAGCPVLHACLTDAVARGEAEGVWGGQSAADRFAPLLLAEVEPVPHRPSRGCYVGGCRRPECTALNTAYVAELRRRSPATRPETVDAGEQLEIGAA